MHIKQPLLFGYIAAPHIAAVQPFTATSDIKSLDEEGTQCEVQNVKSHFGREVLCSKPPQVHECGGDCSLCCCESSWGSVGEC